uniref:Uncharacterized protein n=1 Tax=Spongospora subterranea TaxID=70186 RepID=A0A0H5RE22_9EUKA|eukprot:CRZ06799.1 hypothetical protein [Spongospora subterranea]
MGSVSVQCAVLTHSQLSAGRMKLENIFINKSGTEVLKEDEIAGCYLKARKVANKYGYSIRPTSSDKNPSNVFWTIRSGLTSGSHQQLTSQYPMRIKDSTSTF